MTSGYQTIGFDWHGITVSVAFDPDWLPAYRNVYGVTLWHLQIRSGDGLPLPITETGYKSEFVSGHIMATWEGPEAYVRAWLEEASADPVWLNGRQLSLF
jgi:hypothetical protein